MKYIQVKETNVDVILELFSKEKDPEGFIIEKKTKKRLICPYTREAIRANNFSILPGSATFVKNEPFCFAEHITTHI